MWRCGMEVYYVCIILLVIWFPCSSNCLVPFFFLSICSITLNLLFNFLGFEMTLSAPWRWTILSLQLVHLIAKISFMVLNQSTSLFPLLMSLCMKSQSTLIMLDQQSYIVLLLRILNRLITPVLCLCSWFSFNVVPTWIIYVVLCSLCFQWTVYWSCWDLRTLFQLLFYP